MSNDCKRCKILEMKIEGQEQLLVAYRLNIFRKAGPAIDKISKADEALVKLGAT